MFLPQASHVSAASILLLLRISLSDVHTVGWVSDHFYDSMAFRRCVDIMKTKGLHIRISERRLNKLRLYATSKEKTMTQLIEDWIDRLPLPEGLETSVPPVSR